MPKTDKIPTLVVVADVPPTLAKAQEIVGGYVEMITLAGGEQLLVNEDGKRLGLPGNAEASNLAGCAIVGCAILLKEKAVWK